MRYLLFSLIVMFLLAGCRVKSNDPDIGVVTPDPIPIQDNTTFDNAPPEAESLQPFERDNSTPITSSLASELADDPAPAPPGETLEDPTEANNPDDRSAKDTLDSVTRVLQGALFGEDKETGEPATKSIFGSVGRALLKGFQEAASEDSASEE